MSKSLGHSIQKNAFPLLLQIQKRSKLDIESLETR
jgi:hypothetical protein